jgi:biotin synthase
MLGERCARNCAFCTQARDSQADAGLLSRVNWPSFSPDLVRDRIRRAYASGDTQRVCFQSVVAPQHIAQAEQAVAALVDESPPICVSVAASTPEEIARLLDAGAERVTVALDAACARVASQAKGRTAWDHTWALLERAAERFPGCIGTHLIAGLGETEQEMIACLAALHRHGILTGLFAFTPVAGARMASQPPPPLESYRRIQAARWLIVKALGDTSFFAYDHVGRLRSLGLSADDVRALLGDGEAFRTAGCPGCNRPYYNEHPGGDMYNYPRQLTPEERQCEIAALLNALI